MLKALECAHSCIIADMACAPSLVDNVLMRFAQRAACTHGDLCPPPPFSTHTHTHTHSATPPHPPTRAELLYVRVLTAASHVPEFRYGHTLPSMTERQMNTRAGRARTHGRELSGVRRLGCCELMQLLSREPALPRKHAREQYTSGRERARTMRVRACSDETERLQTATAKQM